MSVIKSRVRIIIDPRNLAHIERMFKESLDKGLDKSAQLLRKMLQEIKAESQAQVPYDTGNLHDAAHYKVWRNPKSVSGRIWYDTDKAPYAWIQHEVPPDTFRHEMGRKWKFLEDPVTERLDDIEDLWAEAFEGVWR